MDVFPCSSTVEEVSDIDKLEVRRGLEESLSVAESLHEKPQHEMVNRWFIRFFFYAFE